MSILWSYLWVIDNRSMTEYLLWNVFSEILTFRSKRFLRCTDPYCTVESVCTLHAQYSSSTLHEPSE